MTDSAPTLSRNLNYLDFEQPIFELQTKIEELERLSKQTHTSDHTDLSKEIKTLSGKCERLKDSIYRSLSDWQIAQMARHPKRPYTYDYIAHLFEDFEELHGDRAYADDAAIVSGIARFKGQPIAVIGHQKGRTMDEKLQRNFGMPYPEGYRKANRVFKLAEKFQMPLITFIDTPGAYPGIGAEERNQSIAIAENLYALAQLKTPIISVVIGEGGSGGALAIGVCDVLMMLQYSTYSVISPEGCASILWRDTKYAQQSAEALCITAEKLLQRRLIDELIPEPLGGAQQNLKGMCNTLQSALSKHLTKLNAMSEEDLVERRYKKLTDFGAHEFWHEA